jgi:hypothetical protein
MFDSRFKNMLFVTIYLANENVIVAVAKYDENLLLMETNKLLTHNKVEEACCLHS